jgi:hypothetical protein
MLVDYSLIKKAIHRYGENVTLVSYSDRTFSDWGDLLSATTTGYSAKAIFNTYGINQRFVEEGQFGETNFSFFFDGEQEGVVIDNYIVRTNGEVWKINRALVHCIEGSVKVQEARVTNG